MAKMFYTLEETAQRLSVSEDKVRELGGSGDLQVFRDGDRMMFKRDQVDEMSSSSATSGSSIPLQDTAALNLELASESGEDSAAGSGINVFEADEIESADPMAQTQITEAEEDDDELVLESVGSGSGLLDLSREDGDDTSLGSDQLLDEIKVGDSGADAKVGSFAGSSGAFDSALEMDGTAGREGVQPGAEVAGLAPAGYGEPFDPAGSGLATGLLIGTMVCLVVTLIVTIYAVTGVKSALTTMLTEKFGVGMSSGGLLLICVVAGLAGFLIGKTQAK